jgi:hypothetical protein
MIYHDEDASRDEEDCPKYRRCQNCINCGKTWGEHNGWRCPPWSKNCNKNFSDISPNQRYCTQSMLDSLKHAPKNPKPYEPKKENAERNSEVDPSTSWRAWAHSIPGECPCGIPIAACSYHNDNITIEAVK